MMFTFEIFKPKTPRLKWKYYRCLVHHFIHVSIKFSLTYLVSLETLGSPQEFKIKMSNVWLHSTS